MLKRLVGEDIDFTFNLSEDLWKIEADPHQIEQIIMNFSANARDAIDRTGTITIETHNTILDDPYQQKHVYAIPGEYVMLVFSDSGCGMSAETQDKIFEPFYTTKETDKGTGLGLATVFGIVKQNNGYISVYSEPGMGATFKVYLPRYKGDDAAGVEEAPEIELGGNETILIVEDEPYILDIVNKILENHGYTPIPCPTAEKAIQTIGDYESTIHMLLTDVVMPTMNGKELQEKITAMKPAIKTVFMSGYTADVIAQQGVIDKGVNFVQKPFSMKSLLTTVRAVLDR